MKVLHTIYGLNKKLGGPSSCTYNLVKGLNNIGVDTQILTLSSDNTDDDIAHDHFIHYEKDDAYSPLKISRNFGNFLDIHGGEFDIIHGNTIWLWHTHQAAKYAKKANKPFVLSPHGMLYAQALKVSAWKKKLILPLFQRKDLETADVIHATSEQELKEIRNFGLKNPVAIIPNMLVIDKVPDVRAEVNKVRRYGFVGRINPIKNIDILLEAWHSLGDKTDNSELYIIGDGNDDYEAVLKQYVRENGLTNVVFTGFKSGNELSEMVRSLDFQILPSKSENFGMVVPEALIYGVPVIASTGTPWGELVNNNCGWWVNPTSEGIADAIKQSLDISEIDRRTMGENGRNLVKRKYMATSVANMMRELYEWVLTGNNKPDFVYD